MYIYLHRHVFQIEFLVGKKLKRQRKFLKCCVLNACCMHSNKVYTTYNCTIYDNQPILLKRELLNAGLFYIQHLYKYVCAFDKKKCISISVNLMLNHILELFTNKPGTLWMLHYNMLLDMPHVYTRKKSPYFGRQSSSFII